MSADFVELWSKMSHCCVPTCWEAWLLYPIMISLFEGSVRGQAWGSQRKCWAWWNGGCNQDKNWKEEGGGPTPSNSSPQQIQRLCQENLPSNTTGKIGRCKVETDHVSSLYNFRALFTCIFFSFFQFRFGFNWCFLFVFVLILHECFIVWNCLDKQNETNVFC